jgi:tetratricopeptide (TPR) repeat protein
MNDFIKAQEYYERALNIEFDTYAVMGLALIAKIQGKYDEAGTSLRRLIQQDSKNSRLFMELADCFLKKGDKNQAVEVLEEYHRLGHRDTKVFEMLEAI